MIENSKYNAKWTFAEFLNYFVPVIDMVIIAKVVLLLICIESIVGCLIQFAPFCSSWQLWIFTAPFLSLLDVEVVDGLVLLNFFALNFGQIVAETFHCFCNSHWELVLADVSYRWGSICIWHFHAHRSCYVYFRDLAACTYWSGRLQCWPSWS